MADVNRKYWNQQFKILQDTWPKPVDFEKCIEICLEVHAMVHTYEVSKSGVWSFEDELWGKLTENTFRKCYEGNQSIAWKLWHSGRIEDITMNILIADEQQVFNTGDWFDRLKVSARDTGNAMNGEEIDALSQSIDMQVLKEYRLAVGQKTRSIIKSLKPEDLKLKMATSRLKRVMDEGAVAEEAGEVIDYWSKKTYSGLLLMPATRHILIHLNESMELVGKRNG